MHHQLLLGLSAIIVLGIGAQWLAWRFRVPSILLLLLFGFIAGPVSGFLSPDALFGESLFPIVSLAVAIILFEGGLTLKLSEMRTVGGEVRNLLAIGIPATWFLSTAAAYYVLDLEFVIALLFGAILVVTGPTVILPLLRLVRPTERVNSILKWEGILNDPIGALLAVLVFEGILATSIQAATTGAIIGFALTLFLGGGVGLIGGYLLMQLLKHHLVPQFLQNAVTLTIVTMVFTVSNLVQSESGLFAATIMGIFLANQRSVVVHHIVEFKENVRVLLIASLFIILAARLDMDDLTALGWSGGIFLAALIFLIRPATVLMSTIGSDLSWRERVFVGWMAPRGIVAAAVASLFALQLSELGYSSAERLVPLTFLVIVGTISIYGLSALPLGNSLGIADPHPQGVLIAGANRLARRIALILGECGFSVQMVDTSWSQVARARMHGLSAHYGSILSEDIDEDIDLGGIGRLIAVTPNDEINSLAAIYFRKMFGPEEVYQLSRESDDPGTDGEGVSGELKGRLLFGEGATYARLEHLLDGDASLKVTPLTSEYNYDAFRQHYAKQETIPMFQITPDGELEILTAGGEGSREPGTKLISLIGANGDEPGTSGGSALTPTHNDHKNNQGDE